jgi:hypothetical protein
MRFGDFSLVATLGFLLALTACPSGDDDDASGDDDVTSADDDSADDDSGDDDAGDDDSADDDSGDDDSAAEQDRWTFAVFMNGDNNCEEGVTPDLNELELVGSGDGVNVVVQADRIDGYATDDGDWTGTRRYFITADGDPEAVSSTVVEDLGELDMGDPQVLSDFLVWAHTNYPAEHMALIIWNHGDSWTMNVEGSPGDRVSNLISSDDTDGNSISIAEGELHTALEAVVQARGPLDLVGFDACLMGSWEVAHSLKDQVLYMIGAETTIYMDEGYVYDRALMLLRDTEAAADGAALALEMANSAVNGGGEWTHSAIDLTTIGDVSVAVDQLAGLALSDGSLKAGLLQARTDARGADFGWGNWYLDLYDLATVLSGSADPQLSAAGDDLLAAMDVAVLGCWGMGPYSWLGGLTIMFDLNWPDYLDLYAYGDGATWSQDTRWDDLLLDLTVH